MIKSKTPLHHLIFTKGLVGRMCWWFSRRADRIEECR